MEKRKPGLQPDGSYILNEPEIAPDFNPYKPGKDRDWTLGEDKEKIEKILPK